jgi:DNA-binding NarL/FixJ family response regulator
MDLSLEHLELLDLDRLATADLEQALPLLLDLTDFIQGTAAATAIVTHAVGAARAGEAGPRRRALVLALELTATERRVADLIAAGATNRDAAVTLFVSVRTVETHVAAIYRKLGVRTRAELARRIAAQ